MKINSTRQVKSYKEAGIRMEKTKTNYPILKRTKRTLIAQILKKSEKVRNASLNKTQKLKMLTQKRNTYCQQMRRNPLQRIANITLSQFITKKGRGVLLELKNLIGYLKLKKMQTTEIRESKERRLEESMLKIKIEKLTSMIIDPSTYVMIKSIDGNTQDHVKEQSQGFNHENTIGEEIKLMLARTDNQPVGIRRLVIIPEQLFEKSPGEELIEDLQREENYRTNRYFRNHGIKEDAKIEPYATLKYESSEEEEEEEKQYPSNLERLNIKAPYKNIKFKFNRKNHKRQEEKEDVQLREMEEKEYEKKLPSLRRYQQKTVIDIITDNIRKILAESYCNMKIMNKIDNNEIKGLTSRVLEAQMILRRCMYLTNEELRRYIIEGGIGGHWAE